MDWQEAIAVLESLEIDNKADILEALKKSSVPSVSVNEGQSTEIEELQKKLTSLEKLTKEQADFLNRETSAREKLEQRLLLQKAASKIGANIEVLEVALTLTKEPLKESGEEILIGDKPIKAFLEERHKALLPALFPLSAATKLSTAGVQGQAKDEKNVAEDFVRSRYLLPDYLKVNGMN